jgi:serine/threonine-protein kinase
VSHKVTGKKLVLKCLLPQYLDYPELVERFLREAQAAGRIQHRHVVDVFDVGRDGSVLYIVMPYLEGKPLSALLREKAVSLDEILALVLRAMEGVAAAHVQGIVHRDLKPDNIFVCKGPSGRLDDPRVLDFGISKLDDEEEKRSLTKSGVLMGTPHYMSFEQLNSQRDIDARADVYAMGCILYEAMAGELPYVAESAPSLAIRMMSGPPKHLSARRPDLPQGLVDAVMKSIERERSDRFPTMEAMIAALAEFVPEHVSSGMTPPSDGEARLSRKLARPDFMARQAGEDKTLPAPTPTPKNDDIKTVLTPSPVSPATPPASAQPITVRTQPQLKLGNEPERMPNQAAQHQPPVFRLGLLATGVLVAVAIGVSVWGAKKVASPTTVDNAVKPAAAEPVQKVEPSYVAEAEPVVSEKPKKTVVRKIKRKKVNPAAAGQAGGTAAASAQPFKPAGELSAIDKAALEEWEEVEETVVVEEGEQVEGEIISETPIPATPSADKAAPAPAAGADGKEAATAKEPAKEAPAGEPKPETPVEPSKPSAEPPAAATDTPAPEAPAGEAAQ